MKYFKMVFILVTLSFVSGCQTDSAKFPILGIDSFTDSSLVLFDDIDQTDFDEDPVSINSAGVSGNILTLNVSFSGGCKDHEFRLYIWKGLSKSNPPQAEVFLSHDANEDGCEAYLTPDKAFDLTPLKNHIRKNFYNVETVYLRIYAPGTTEPYQPLVKFNL